VADGPAPAPQTLSVRETAGLAAAWSAKTTATWLRVSPTTGATPASLGVHVDAGALPPGRHQASVVVTLVGGASTTQVPVTVDVTEAPLPSAPAPGGGGTAVLTVTSGSDDASEAANGTVRPRESAQRLGRGYLQAWRFRNVAIPPGATILSAKLELYGVAYTGEDVTLRYTGEAAADAAPLAAIARDLSSRARTDAGVVDTPSPWTRFAYNAMPDLAPVVQEIVDVSGWRAGASLVLFAVDEGSDAVRMVGTAETAPAGARGARLTVRYSVP
jgi:hypothetical protein